MSKVLKNVLSKTEPDNTNVVWYQPTEGGIIPKVFRGGWQALIQGAAGDNTQVIEWSHTHNMNDYKEAGTYRIKGERTGNPLDDNLPIMNQGSGHTIEGILYVLDSSLANGSGKEDDCTITQFLMLSNRVGGQEGDMYMRSAYGVSKDNLTWKPWEKYQTNMEVGMVNNNYTLNPSNPTQYISWEGMNHLTDNGIYSGVYLSPKAMIGTPDDNAFIKDETAIETFVMVVINNYQVAGDARCVTQIKFAVTNGGVFSMEKRSTTPGGGIYDFSQWEGVGGDLPEGVKFYDAVQPGSKYLFGKDIMDLDVDLQIDSGVALGRFVKIANNSRIGRDVYIKEEVAIDTGVTIGKNVSIPDNLSFSIADNILTITDGTNTWKLTAEQ